MGWPFWSLLTAAGALCACLIHAHHARGIRDARSARSRRIVEVLGTPDLALSSTSRWLRHPSQAEPAAAAQDGPAWLDTDPAGGLLRPPIGLYAPAMTAVQNAGDAESAVSPLGAEAPRTPRAQERR